MIYRAIIVIVCAITALIAIGKNAKAQDGNPFSGATSINVTMTRVETGIASYYGGKHHGRLTASGKRFDQYGGTCAHKTMPFGAVLRVTTRAGRSIECTVTDRGPFIRGRIVDLSVKHARDLQMIGPGVLPVIVERVR